MRLAIDHRGPDGHDTVFVDPAPPAGGGHPVRLAHTRLAIIDTSEAGRQPMRDESGAWITFNGEIYNYAGVGRDLRAAGRPCRGRTDTEVILRGYAAWGPDSVQRLRGMFAWALADPAEGTVWLCRDRPRDQAALPGARRASSGGLLFASEVRALLAAGPELVPPRVSAQALESFLAQGDGVRARERDRRDRVARGGDVARRRLGRTRARRTRSLLASPVRPRARGLDEAARRDAVGRLHTTLPRGGRLPPDRGRAARPLPLEHGVDSSAVAAVATEVRARDAVRTLAMGFDQPQFDESGPAGEIARELGTEHRAVMLTGDEMLRDIGEVFAAMDQPTVDGFNTFFVCRAARRAGLTVALSGVGEDELFGGYGTFRTTSPARSCSRAGAQELLGSRRGDDGRSALSPLRSPFGGRAAVKLAETLTRTPSVESMYLLRRELFLAAERQRASRPAGRERRGVGGPRARARRDGCARDEGDVVKHDLRLRAVALSPLDALARRGRLQHGRRARDPGSAPRSCLRRSRPCRSPAAGRRT